MSNKTIMDEAMKLFASEGYKDTSLSLIAEKVGIKKPSIYAHFSSKKALYLTILDNELNKFLGYMEKNFDGVQQLETEKGLKEFFLETMEYVIENPFVQKLLGQIMFSPSQQVVEDIDRKMNSFKKRIYDMLVQMLNHGIHNGEIKPYEIDDLVYSYFSLIHGNFAMLLSSDMVTRERLMHSWEIYWNGIKNAEKHM